MASRKLIVQIVGDSSSLERSFDRSGRAAKGFGMNVSASFGQLVKGTLVVGAVSKAVEGLSAALHAGIEEFSEHAKVAAQTAAALTSTGGVAGVTAKQIDDLALSLSNLSGIDDEAIASGENLLLTFTKIRNQAGKGNDIFDQATKSVVDLSVAFHKDLNTSAVLVGKALNDPIKGVTALRRVGVAFTADQVKLIKKLVESGHALDAQKLILRELKVETGGAAAALGKTLPGQLNILKERFKDLAGSGIGLVAPAVGRAATALTDFVKKLSETQGARAKISLVFTGIKEIGRQLFDQLRRSFEAIDFGAAVQSVGDGLQRGLRAEARLLSGELRIFEDAANSIGARIQAAFRAVDWVAVGHAIIDGFGQAGRLASEGIVAALGRITEAVKTVNFNQVGKTLADGLIVATAFAITAVGNFLIHVDWIALIGSTIRLAVAAFKGFHTLLLSAGLELGRALLRGVSKGLTSLGGVLEEQALKIILKVVKKLDFSIAGRHVIPGINSLVDSIQKKIDSLHGKNVVITVTTKQAAAAVGGIAGRRNFDPSTVPTPTPRTPAVTAPTPKPLDTALGIGGSPTTSTGPTAAEKAAKALAALIGRLNLAVAKAGLTKTLADDLAANAKLVAELKKQVGLHKDDLDLANQLVSAELARNTLLEQRKTLLKEQNAAALAARNARQFKTLGLGPTGDALIPLKAGLARQLKQVTDSVAGTFLDTGKTQKVLAAIRKLVLNPFTKISAEVRATIKGMLDDITNQLKEHPGPLTKTTSLASAGNLFGGLGLDRATQKSLQARLSGFNSGGVRLAGAGAGGAFGPGLPNLAVRRVDVHTHVEVNGKEIASATERDVTKNQQRRGRQNPATRRGRR